MTSGGRKNDLERRDMISGGEKIILGSIGNDFIMGEGNLRRREDDIGRSEEGLNMEE